jgi:hypothetical protein
LVERIGKACVEPGKSKKGSVHVITVSIPGAMKKPANKQEALASPKRGWLMINFDHDHPPPFDSPARSQSAVTRR